MTHKFPKIITAILALNLFSIHLATADIVIVMANNAKLSSIDLKQANRVWLGKAKKINSEKIEPLEQSDSSTIHAEFHKLVTQKKPSELKSYWGRLIFSGKYFPPKVLQSDTEVKSWLSANPNSIGYIDASSVDDTVKVLMTLH